MDKWFKERNLLDDFKIIERLLDVVLFHLTSDFYKVINEGSDLAFSHAIAFLKKSIFTIKSIHSLGLLDKDCFSEIIFEGFNLELDSKKETFFQYNYQSWFY